jgi:Ca2+-binding RTX toxin-like protein
VAQHITIKNAGLIDSEKNGIWLLNATGAAPVIVNSGTISGTVNAILAESGDRLNVDNSGHLIGNVRGTSTNQIDTVTNTGTIKGSVFLGSGSDRYTGIATVDDTLVSGKVSGTVFGESGNDTLTGGNGVDRLHGGAGLDKLGGGGGNDTLNGGANNDTLTGGAGKDAFAFDSALNNNIDNITDFSVADDTVNLAHGVFAALGLGTLAIAAFHIGAAAHDTSDRIIYNSATGAVLYDDDGTGAHAAVQFATLSHDLALTRNDFVIA